MSKLFQLFFFEDLECKYFTDLKILKIVFLPVLFIPIFTQILWGILFIESTSKKCSIIPSKDQSLLSQITFTFQMLNYKNEDTEAKSHIFHILLNTIFATLKHPVIFLSPRSQQI